MKAIKILSKLKECESPISSKELSYLINMSSKSTSQIIKKLSSELEGQGATIESKRGKGYKLEIYNKELFEEFFKKFIEKKDSKDFGSSEFRINYLVNKFIESKDFIKADDLIEEMFISRSQVFKDLKVMRELFESYGLNLVNKPHYGLKLDGDEFHYRRCIANLYIKNKNNIKDEKAILNNIEKIKEIIGEAFLDQSYRISDLVEERLVFHLYTTIERIKKGYFITRNEEVLNIQKREKEYPLAVKISKMIEKEFEINIAKEECGFIAVHLASKSMRDEKHIVNISPEINDLVDDMLNEVRNKKSIDLRDNLDLRILLALHILPLDTRIRYNMPLKNPLLEEIKTKFLAAYDIAICATKLINKKYNINLSEDEISYFALHFQVALSKSLDKIKKKNILIVCSSGRGSAQLLKHKFISVFEKYINNIDTCNANEIEVRDLRDIDYIFSTIPLNCEIPVFQIHHFLEESDIRKIKDIFLNKVSKNDREKYFKRELFIKDIEGSSKKEVLEFMVNKIKVEREISENFLEEVLKREEFASTDLNSNVAFPHPQNPLTEETFVTVGVLKKPVFWGKNKVQLVFLASIEKGEIKELQDFYKAISTIMCSQRYVNEIIDSPKIETLYKILEEID